MTEEQAIKTEYSDNEAEPKAPETVLEENASTDASAVETSQAGSKTDDNLEVNSVSGDADAEKKSETNGHSVEHEAAEKHPVKKHNPNATHSLKKPNGSKSHSGKGTNGHTLKSVNGQAAKGTKGTKGASKAPRRKKTIYEKLRNFLGVMAVAFAVAVLVTHYFLPIVSVESPSMEGTIHEGSLPVAMRWISVTMVQFMSISRPSNRITSRSRHLETRILSIRTRCLPGSSSSSAITVRMPSIRGCLSLGVSRRSRSPAR